MSFFKSRFLTSVPSSLYLSRSQGGQNNGSRDSRKKAVTDTWSRGDK